MRVLLAIPAITVVTSASAAETAQNPEKKEPKQESAATSTPVIKEYDPTGDRRGHSADGEGVFLHSVVSHGSDDGDTLWLVLGLLGAGAVIAAVVFVVQRRASRVTDVP